MALDRLRRHGNIVAFDIVCETAPPDVGLESMPGRYGHLTCASRDWPTNLMAVSWTSNEGTTFDFKVDVTNSADVISKLIFEVLSNFSCVLVTHHMEWKALVVETALHASGLSFLAGVWQELAADGLCLMSPYTCSLWRARRAHYTSVSRLCETFLRGSIRPIACPPVGQRAELFWLATRGIERALSPSCARGEEPHCYQQVPLAGPRDNGEREYVCRLCGKRSA